jgi:hypothetical protein
MSGDSFHEKHSVKGKHDKNSSLSPETLTKNAVKEFRLRHPKNLKTSGALGYKSLLPFY